MEDKIRIGNRTIGLGEPIFIVAEIANTHEGSFETSLRMIDTIAPTGIDCVKFQLHIPEAEMIRAHPKFYTQGKRSLSINQLAELKAYAESLGLCFLCTPFSREAADQLEEIGVGAFKIGSGEMTDLPFIEHVARKGKSMIISTGMSEWDEIEEVFNLVVGGYGCPLVLAHCVSVYPTSYNLLNLGVIRRLRACFEVPVGLSDHTPEIFSAIAAVPYGISFLEKHYTLDRTQVGTSDHKVSLEPSEFNVLVDGIRKIEKALGNEKKIFDEERPVVEWARHSVVTIRDISKDQVISADDISTKRPLYNGIPAKYLWEVIGRRPLCNLPRDSIVKWEDLSQA